MTDDTDIELNILCSAEYENFLRQERLFEQKERQVSNEDFRTFVRAFLTALVTGGICLMLLIWRIAR